jgi:hypothetical protein
MFDKLTELKDDEYELRRDIDDEILRDFRAEHNIVNDGLKDIRKNLGAKNA